MNREQVFQRVEQIFTGTPDRVNSTLREYWNLSPEKGLENAKIYLESAEQGQMNSGSDWGYWAWEGDITMAKVLIGIFQHLVKGNTDFPEPPENNGFLMDKTAALQAWSEKL